MVDHPDCSWISTRLAVVPGPGLRRTAHERFWARGCHVSAAITVAVSRVTLPRLAGNEPVPVGKWITTRNGRQDALACRVTKTVELRCLPKGQLTVRCTWCPGTPRYRRPGHRSVLLRFPLGQLSNDATVIVPLAPSAWAPLYGMLKDRFGITWSSTSPPNTTLPDFPSTSARPAGRALVDSSAYSGEDASS